VVRLGVNRLTSLQTTVKLGYNIMKDTENFVFYKRGVYIYMVNSELLTGITEYLTLLTWCGINQCRY
jgi:hypothetical protein